MLDAYPEKVTKAGAFEDLIASVDTHYSKSVLTKAGTPLEDAYVVNFVDDGGFAVLGANNKVGDIIAVTEGGSIKVEDIDSAYEAAYREEILFYDEDGNKHTSFYCEEDDDYYSAGNFLLPVLIFNGINSNDDGRDGPSGSGPNGSGLCTIAPMIKTRWNQGDYHTQDVYNKYCKKNGKCVLAGCSTTALAQIITYNRFPSKIGGENMDYYNIASQENANRLDEVYKEHVSRLFGNIFNNVSKSILGNNGTLITPEQIKRRMISYGYSNVKKTIISEITTYTIHDISSMLSQGKPVFFSAIARSVEGHSWVIDGAKYSSGGGEF